MNPGQILVATFLLAIVASVYFIPAIIARNNHKRNTTAIFWLNAFLGWTFLGWVTALVWALTYEDDNVT